MVRSFKLSEGATEIAKQLMADGNDFKSSVLMAIRLADETEPSDDVLKILARDEKFTKRTLMDDKDMNKFALDDYDSFEEDYFAGMVPLVDDYPTDINEIQRYRIPEEFENLKPIIQQMSEKRIARNQLQLPGFIQKDPFAFDDYPKNPEQFARALVDKYGPNPTRANFRREIMYKYPLIDNEGRYSIASNPEYNRAKEARKYALWQLGMLDA